MWSTIVRISLISNKTLVKKFSSTYFLDRSSWVFCHFWYILTNFLRNWHFSVLFTYLKFPIKKLQAVRGNSKMWNYKIRFIYKFYLKYYLFWIEICMQIRHVPKCSKESSDNKLYGISLIFINQGSIEISLKIVIIIP